VGWTHIRDETRRARKPHWCYLCGGDISPGTTYLCRTGVSDGEMVSTAMHTGCEEKTRDWDEMDWETFSPGELENWLTEP